MGGKYKQNQQLEELRNLQDRMAREKRAWQLEKEAVEQEIETKKKELSKTKIEIDRGLKDVKQQRDELYRKLDLLKAQGIEIGPNMSVLKTDIPVSGSGSALSTPQAELLYYSEVVNDPAAANISPPGTVNLGVGNISSLRKPSSVSTSGLHLSASNASSSSSSSGTLKKDSVANLNLLSTTNEAKVKYCDFLKLIILIE